MNCVATLAEACTNFCKSSRIYCNSIASKLWVKCDSALTTFDCNYKNKLLHYTLLRRLAPQDSFSC